MFLLSLGRTVHCIHRYDIEQMNHKPLSLPLTTLQLISHLVKLVAMAKYATYDSSCCRQCTPRLHVTCLLFIGFLPGYRMRGEESAAFDWKCCQCCQVFKIAMLNMFRLLFHIFHVVSNSFSCVFHRGVMPPGLFCVCCLSWKWLLAFCFVLCLPRLLWRGFGPAEGAKYVYGLGFCD